MWEPAFYGDLVYKFRKSVGRKDFSDQFRKIIIRNKRTGQNMNVMRQTACLVVNPITFDNFATLFNYTLVDLRHNDGSGWGLSFVKPIGVQMLGFCSSSVSVLILLLSTHLISSQYWILICMFAVLMHRWIEVFHADRTTWLKPSPLPVMTVPRRYFYSSLF